MSRAKFASCWLGLALSVTLSPALKAQQAPPPTPSEQEPPEEDASLKPKEYALNPLQAAKEIDVGNQHFRKGKYSAAAYRFREATRWDPGSAEAFLRLGEAEEKLHDYNQARDAYAQYFALAKDPKDADAIKKRMAKWPHPVTN